MFDHRAFAMEFDKEKHCRLSYFFFFIPILLEIDITYVTPSIVFTFSRVIPNVVKNLPKKVYKNSLNF